MTSHYLTGEASAKRIEALVDRLVSEAVQWTPRGSRTVLWWPQSSDYHLVPDYIRRIVRTRAEARLRASKHQESRK